ncbi:MAG: GerW family sporulation protein [Acutalibacteraceae bacterium]
MSDTIKNIMGDTVDQIRSMASVDTIIGDPVDLGEGIRVIPVSKISYGFASGGSDIPSAKTSKEVFGGGGGAGVTVTPVAFLVVQNGNVKIMSVDNHPTSVDKAVELIPDMFDRIISAVDKAKKNKAEDVAPADAADSSDGE